MPPPPGEVAEGRKGLTMNKRLQAIEALVRPGRGLIDVGTDHGYLPLSLARHGYPGALFASDLREGPLNAARRSAAAAGLSSRIGFQLCDGLDGCDRSAVDTIVIAGMGGDTICGILDRAEWCMDPRYTLILQPMTRAEVLRYWLTNNGFVIEAERLAEDAGELYALLRTRFGGEQKLSDAELYTGAFEQIEPEELWPAFLSRQRDRMEKLLVGLRKSGREPGRLRLMEAVAEELKEREAHAKYSGNL